MGFAVVHAIQNDGHVLFWMSLCLVTMMVIVFSFFPKFVKIEIGRLFDIKTDQKTSIFDILILTVLSSNLRKVKKNTFSICLDSSNISERTICISDRKAEIEKNYAIFFYTKIVGLIDT